MKGNRWQRGEDKWDAQIPIPVDEIYSGIERELGRSENDTNIDRGSSANQCVKQRWYKGKGYTPTPITPRQIVNFIQGDIAEAVVLSQVKKYCMGKGKTYKALHLGKSKGSVQVQHNLIEIYEQLEFSFDLDGIPIVCHPDGIGECHDGTYELIEVKSAANWSYKKMVDTGAGDYLKQAHANLMCDQLRKMKVKKMRFYYLRKETGHLWSSLHYYNHDTAKLVAEEYRVARREEEPEAPYDWVEEVSRKQKTGRLKLDFPCNYCGFKDVCKGPMNFEFSKVYGSGSLKPTFYKKEDK